MVDCPSGRYSPLPTSEAVEVGSEEHNEQGRLESLRLDGLRRLEQPEVQIASATVILLNSIVTGLETDHPGWPYWEVIENGFLVFFSIELLGRVAIITPSRYFKFFGNDDFIWNVFDVVIVSIGLVDLVMSQMIHSSSMKFATVFRIVRLCRLLRILRIFRFLRQLYLFMYGFAEAFMAIVWVSILMTFVLYVCGIVLAKLYGSVGSDDPDYIFLSTRFGTVSGSMLTLFELMSSPDLAPYHSVMHNHPSILPFLVGFIIFGSFGMIALLTGVISESMFEKNKARVEEERLEREQRRTKFQKECGDLFDVMCSESGSATAKDLARHKEEVFALLLDAGASVTAAELDQMFLALDSDASGTIDRLEFENGVMQLCEDIRPMSIMEIHHSVRKCHGLVESCYKDLQLKIDEIYHGLETLVPLADLEELVAARRTSMSVGRTPSSKVSHAPSYRFSRQVSPQDTGCRFSPKVSQDPSYGRASQTEGLTVVSPGVQNVLGSQCRDKEKSTRTPFLAVAGSARSRSPAWPPMEMQRASSLHSAAGSRRSRGEFMQEANCFHTAPTASVTWTQRRESSASTSEQEPEGAREEEAKTEGSERFHGTASPSEPPRGEEDEETKRSACRCAAETLCEFRKKLEALFVDVQKEMTATTVKNVHAEYCSMLQAQHAAALDSFAASLEKVARSIAVKRADTDDDGDSVGCSSPHPHISIRVSEAPAAPNVENGYTWSTRVAGATKSTALNADTFDDEDCTNGDVH